MKRKVLGILAAISLLIVQPAFAQRKGTNISTMDMQTTNQLSGYVPAKGKIGMDTTKNTLYVGDGSTTGGIPQLREDFKNATANWSISNFWCTFDEFASGSAAETTTDSYVSTDVGSHSEVLQDANSGTWLLTNGASDDDLVSIQSAKEHLLLTAGKKTIAEVRFTLNEATENDVLIGWVIRDTTPLANTDGLYFHKPDDQTTYEFVGNMDSTPTSVSSVATADTSAHTYSFECNGTVSCTPYIDGVAGTPITTNLPTDEELAFTVYLRNGEAVAKTLILDYWSVTQER